MWPALAVLASAVGTATLASCELAFPAHELTGDAAPACMKTCVSKNTIACSSGEGSSASCPLGCLPDSTLGARCHGIVPSGVAKASDFDGAAANARWSSPTGYVVNADDGAIISGSKTIRPSGIGLDSASGITYRVADQLGDTRVSVMPPRLGIFGFHSLAVAPMTTVTVIGKNAAALLVATTLGLDGVLVVRGDCATQAPGPGGYGAASGPEPGASGINYQCGGGSVNSHCNPIPPDYCMSAGGGAGFGGPGGSSNVSKGGAGGEAFPPLDGGPFALFGGSGGGEGAGPGGAGGGAIQLVAGVSITVGPGGIVDACGCGGASGGGGGGAGGMVVLEAPSVSVHPLAVIAANGGGGGGGGGGRFGGGGTGGGSDGRLGNAPAPGGNGGGQGGALLGAPGDGPNGGGGGAVGRVLLNSQHGPLGVPDAGPEAAATTIVLDAGPDVRLDASPMVVLVSPAPTLGTITVH